MNESIVLLSSYTRITAIIPVRKTPSNVPAPPMLAIGAPSSPIPRRVVRSAPIRVPGIQSC